MSRCGEKKKIHLSLSPYWTHTHLCESLLLEDSPLSLQCVVCGTAGLNEALATSKETAEGQQRIKRRKRGVSIPVTVTRHRCSE